MKDDDGSIGFQKDEIMDHKQQCEKKEERRPYVRKEEKKLGKLNLLIKGSGSCGAKDSFPATTPMYKKPTCM